MSETTDKPIRVLLVDDHAVVRKGMRALLEEAAAGEPHPGRAVRAARRTGHARRGWAHLMGGVARDVRQGAS